MTHKPLCGWIKVSQCLLILGVFGGEKRERKKKKVRALQRASTEATWITAPEVSAKAVNINDSYHPPPGLLQPGSLHFSSSALFKGRESCSEQERQYCWQESFFFFLPPLPSSSPLPRLSVGGESWPTGCIAPLFKKIYIYIAPLSSDHRWWRPGAATLPCRRLVIRSNSSRRAKRGFPPRPRDRGGGDEPKSWTPNMLRRINVCLLSSDSSYFAAREGDRRGPCWQRRTAFCCVICVVETASNRW